jgi:hypothetical protein
MAEIATAASTAFPPFRRISMPACEARWCGVVATPFIPITDTIGETEEVDGSHG